MQRWSDSAAEEVFPEFIFGFRLQEIYFLKGDVRK